MDEEASKLGIEEKAIGEVRSPGLNNAEMTSCKNTRKPECSRCKNHGNHIGVKNHKRYCPYGSCKCDKCILTAERQRIMAQQVKLRREQAQDEEMEKRRKLKERVSFENAIRKNEEHSNLATQEKHDPTCPENDREILLNDPTRQNSKVNKMQVMQALDSLLSMLDTSNDVAFVVGLYAILKECKFNKVEAYNKIIQAHEELKFLHESCVFSSLNSCCSQKFVRKPIGSLYYQHVHCYSNRCASPNSGKFLQPIPTNNISNGCGFFSEERPRKLSKQLRTEARTEETEKSLPRLLRVENTSF